MIYDLCSIIYYLLSIIYYILDIRYYILYVRYYILDIRYYIYIYTRFEACIMHALLTMLLQRCCHFASNALPDPNALPEAMALSTFLSRRRRIVVATTRNRCQEAPKSAPGGSKIDPRSCPNRAKIAQGVPGAPQERPRSAQERPKSAQERPKSAPRAPQERPRSPQERPRMTQERPRVP